MNNINVTKKDDQTFDIVVESQSTTTHQVTVSDAYVKQLSLDDYEKENIVKKSFEFLLERESNTMIFSSFDLPVIQSYFPEYEQTIKKMMEKK